MRILIVHNILNDSRSVSGVLTEYVHMANAWIEAGHQTDFLAAKAARPQLQRLAPKSRLVSSDGIFNATRYLSQTWLYFPAFAYRALTAHWVRLPERYDVVYASSPFIVEVYSARVVARRLRAKLAVKVQHVLASQTGRTGFYDRLFLWGERKSARWINREADLLMCLSEPVGEDYQAFERSLGLTPTPIHPSGCGIDIERYSRFPPADKRYDAVVLGRLHEQKGIFHLPEVWERVQKQLPGARLIVIGDGPHRARMEQMFAERDLLDCVRVTGAVSEVERDALVNESKLGLSLSFEEGWGLSITEFLASGLPVVAYELPVFAKVFPGQLELVPLRDAAGAAAKVVALLRDESRRQILGARGRKFVGRYDYRIMAAQELAMLEALFAA